MADERMVTSMNQPRRYGWIPNVWADKRLLTTTNTVRRTELIPYVRIGPTIRDYLRASANHKPLAAWIVQKYNLR
jgi:hypothetical protein